MRAIFTVLGIIILSGCYPSRINSPLPLAKRTLYSDSIFNYSVAVDPHVFIGDWLPRTTAAGKTEHSLWNGHIDDGKDIFIDLYHASAPCSPALTGASQTTELQAANGQTTWGRVDYYDNGSNIYNPDPDPLCRPPSLAGLSQEEKDAFTKTRSAYALCSEKDGKTVLVCVSQVTDNPALAKDIFETFRWTE